VNYQQAIDWLFSLQKSGIKLGLGNMRRLCRAIGYPNKRLKFVHIAGTNGKGSCAAMLESVLRESGYKTGLYTSPHLVEFGERIQVNRRPLTASQLVSQVEYFQQITEQVRSIGLEPTFFEVVTAMAFRAFEQAKVDIVILETGLGGRLDSTNVVKPECSVITGIGFDHMNYLGNTLTAIAGEKAAIIKRWRPAVIGNMPEEARAVMVAAAKAMNSPLYLPNSADLVDRQLQPPLQRFICDRREYAIPLLGNYQLPNAALVLRICDVLEDGGWSIPENARHKGLEQAEWAGRFQVVCDEPLIVIEGSHNEQGMKATLDTWESLVGKMPERIVFGCLKDKDVLSLTANLDFKGTEVWLVPIEAQRGEDPARLASFFKQAKTKVFASSAEAFEQARQGRKATLVTGSLYLVGQVLAGMREQKHEVLLNG
jgi:dihydrofolate synthase/folylpolyglutamate synthase